MEIPKKVKETRKARTKIERDGDVFVGEKSEVSGETENNRLNDLGVKLMKGFLMILSDLAMESFVFSFTAIWKISSISANWVKFLLQF